MGVKGLWKILNHAVAEPVNDDDLRNKRIAFGILINLIKKLNSL